jgi:hypothetical protein
MGNYYSPNGNLEVWEEKPTGYLTEDEWREKHPPEHVEPSEDEKKAFRISELKSLLASTDYAVIKIAEGEATKEEYSETLANRKAWREEIRALEGE